MKLVSAAKKFGEHWCNMSNSFLEVGIALTSIPEVREITWLTNGCIILLRSRARIWTQSDINVWFLSMYWSFLVINLILVLNIWWCPWVKLSLVLLKRVFAMTSVFSGRILLAFALLYFVLQGQTCLLLQESLDFLRLHSDSLWWIGHLCVCVCVCVNSRRSSRSQQNWSSSASSAWVVVA